MHRIDKAEMTLRNSLAIRRSDLVLVLCDEGTLDIAQIFFQAASRLSSYPVLLEMPVMRYHGDEPSDMVARCMLKSDVVLAPTTYSITYTQATRRAISKGARVATMPGITMDMLEGGGLDADYEGIARSIRKFGRKFGKAREIHITSKEGTDLSVSVERRIWITEDNGLCTAKGALTNLPAGKVFIAPRESTANGRIVFDGAFIGPPVEKVEMTLKDGLATNIQGPEPLRELFKRSRCGRTLCEIGVGMNPSARVIGNVLEDQKALGTVHIGFGDNYTFGGSIRCDMHNDGMVLRPTLTVDGTTVISDGAFKLDL